MADGLAAVRSGSDLPARVASLVGGATRVVVLTGAGMSQESGVPTFRDALTGWWSRFAPEELATERAFRAHPSRVFGWYLARREQARRAEPHAGFGALVRLAARFETCTVVTQNVDGLHRRAGSRDVVELHGSLDAFRCLDAGHPADPAAVDALEGTGGEVPPPPCAVCGSPLRPGVVWFGEPLPETAVARAWDAAARCDVFLAVGTSGVVHPAAGLPHVALARGAAVVEINPQPTPLSPLATLRWGAAAGPALVALGERLGLTR